MHQKIRVSIKREPDDRSSSYLLSLNKAADATEAMFFLTKHRSAVMFQKWTSFTSAAKSCEKLVLKHDE